MPTVMVTATCQNSCPWCFARSRMEEYRSQGIEEMSWQDFLTVVEFYEMSNVSWMALLGGEPTTHSRFIDMLTYLTARGFSTSVVTNAIIPASLADAIAQARFPNVKFAVNSTSYFDHGLDTRHTIDYFLRTMPGSIGLSYTITQRDVLQKNMGPILDRLFLITRFGLSPHLEFQIAVPSHENSDFVPFDQYGAVVELLQRWTHVLQTNGVSVGLDCHCLPPCCVPPGAQLPFAIRSSCRDFVVDIGPNLDVWPCFPWSAETVRLEQFQTLAETQAFFLQRAATEPFLYEGDCAGCPERLSKACDGGCRGFQIARRRLRMNRGDHPSPPLPGAEGRL